MLRFISFEPLLGSVAGADLSDIHWVIVGGESGPRARPMDPLWVREIEAACRRFGTAWVIANQFLHWPGSRADLALFVAEGGLGPQWAWAIADKHCCVCRTARHSPNSETTWQVA